MDTASPTRFDSLPRGLAVVSALAGAMLALVLAGAAIPAVGEGNLEGPGADGPGAEEPGRQATSTRDHGGETLPAAVPLEVWVELPAEAAAGPLRVSVGGAETPAGDAGRVGDGWRVVVMFDLELSEPLLLRNGAVMLAERAAELTALGPVEIVLAGDDVRTSLPPTTSAPALDEALAWIRVRESSRHLQAERRRDFAARERPTVAAAEAAAAGEREALAAHLDRLLDWAAAAAGGGPQLLLYVGGGYEADPAAFYAQALRTAGDDGAEVPPLPELPAAEELGRALSMLGWTVVAFQPPARGYTLLAGAEESDAERLERRFEEDRGLSQVAIGVDPRALRKRQKEDREVAVLADPVEPLIELTEQTGGELLVDPLALPDLAERLRGRHRLRLELDPSPAGPTPLSVVADGREVRSRRWIGSELPVPVSAARARQLLRDELEEGDFWVDAVVEPGEGGAARLTLQLEPELTASELRLTLATPAGPTGTRLTHQPLDAGAAVDGLIRMELPAALAGDGEEPLAVLVEEVRGGRRGTAFASLRAAPSPRAAAVPVLESLASRALRLLPPDSEMVMGPTVFRTLVDESAVTRVDFYLDGEVVATRAAAPFNARLDLGPLPRTRRVLAVAYGAGGGELARDSLLVNGGSGLLEVRIVEPKRGAGSAEEPLVGTVEVTADIRVPDGSRLDRVEFFWRDQLVSTRYAPPFRERVRIEPTSPRGFVRVLARLADGTSGEDVVFLNSPGPSERLEIDLVELYVVVTDGEGTPVTDLPQKRFRLLEDGKPMEIATFGDAGDLPLTVGLAIDSSASMFVKLPRVQRSAREFVRGLESRRDRAFLVGFGSRPLLARTPTSDMPQVIQALDRLTPDGQTAIWEAVAFSLVQLQGVPGKKALIVFSDGADEDPDFSYRTCLRFARTVGAPIYFILSNNEIVRTGGKGLSVRGFLGRLREITTEVGGRVFFTRVGDDLDAVYREIAEELESQYFIGYYSEEGDGREWRKLKVDVKGAGLEARTISGFYR